MRVRPQHTGIIAVLRRAVFFLALHGIVHAQAERRHGRLVNDAVAYRVLGAAVRQIIDEPRDLPDGVYFIKPAEDPVVHAITADLDAQLLVAGAA